MPGMGIFETEDEEDDAGDQTWSSDITTVVTWHFQIALYPVQAGRRENFKALCHYEISYARTQEARGEEDEGGSSPLLMVTQQAHNGGGAKDNKMTSCLEGIFV